MSEQGVLPRRCWRALRCTHTHDRLEVHTAASIGDLDFDAWDECTGGAGAFLSRRFLAALEAAPPLNTTFRYAVITRGTTPLAAIACQLVEVAPRQLAADQENVPGAARRAAVATRNAVLWALGRRLLVCGNLFTTGEHGVAFAPGVQAATVWPRVTRLLASWLRESADFLVLKDFRSESSTRPRSGCTALFTLSTEPVMRLELDPSWQNYGHYLAALKAKYRKAAVEVHAAVEDAGYSLEPQSDCDDARLHELYLQVEKRAEVRFGLLPPEHLRALKTAFPEGHFDCTVIRAGDGSPLGFGTLLRDGRTAHAHIVGFDYAANSRAPIYLRLLHALIARAIDWRCESLCLGRTALEPKARLGAQPLPSDLLIRHRNPLLNLAVMPALRAVPRASAPERHPFRH